MSESVRSASILVVDDDHEMLDFLSEQLTARGFQTFTAASGGQAIERVRSQHFDLAICDLKMPLIDGISCMEQIFRLQPEMHVIMVSGEATVDKAVTAMKKGAFDFLQKPIRMELLLGRIEKALVKGRLETITHVYEKSRSILSQLCLSDLLDPAVKMLAKFFHAESAVWFSIENGSLKPISALGAPSEPEILVLRMAAEKTIRTRDNDLSAVFTDSCMSVLLIRENSPASVFVMRRKRGSEQFNLTDLREATRLAERLQHIVDGSRLFQSFEDKLVELDQVYIALEASKNTLNQAEKLAQLGTHIASAAHEISSPLSAVIGYAELLLSSNELPEGVREPLIIVRREAARCRGMVHELLSYVRDRRPHLAWVTAQKLVRETLESLSPALTSQGVCVEVQMPPNEEGFNADIDQLRQVLINLVKNAAQALVGVEHPKICIRVTTDVETVRIDIQDNGPGISQENLQRVFEPYFSTKAPGAGTGLGLSISEDIIRRHHGKLTVRSSPGAGAEFSLTLLRVQPEKLEVLKTAA